MKQDKNQLSTKLKKYRSPAPNWRWQEASELAKADSTSEDPWIAAAISYIKRAPATSESDIQFRSLIDESITISRMTDAISEKVWLEAFILANTDQERVADLFGYSSPDLVNAYEQLFYDVRCRLNKPLYIYQYAIGSYQSSALLAPISISASAFIKLQGYREGPDHLLQLFPARRTPDFEQKMRQFATEQLSANAVAAALKMNIDSVKIQIALTEMMHARNSMEIESQRPQSVGQALLEAVAAIGKDAGLKVYGEDENENEDILEVSAVRYLNVGTDIDEDDVKTLENVKALSDLKDDEPSAQE